MLLSVSQLHLPSSSNVQQSERLHFEKECKSIALCFTQSKHITTKNSLRGTECNFSFEKRIILKQVMATNVRLEINGLYQYYVQYKGLQLKLELGMCNGNLNTSSERAN